MSGGRRPVSSTEGLAEIAHDTRIKQRAHERDPGPGTDLARREAEAVLDQAIEQILEAAPGGLLGGEYGDPVDEPTPGR